MWLHRLTRKTLSAYSWDAFRDKKIFEVDIVIILSIFALFSETTQGIHDTSKSHSYIHRSWISMLYRWLNQNLDSKVPFSDILLSEIQELEP